MTDSASPIRLGLMTPLSGVVDMYGQEIARAARIACRRINAAGGVLGRPLQLLVADDGSLPASAVVAARELVERDGCIALIGNLLSNSRIAVAQLVEQRLRVPYLNFSYYEGSISGPHFFHFAALPNQQITPLIRHMGRHAGLKMYFAGNNYEWPRGSIEAAKQTLSQIDGDVVGEEYLPIGVDPCDIDRLLDDVARSGADVLLPFFAGRDQLLLFGRLAERGLGQRLAVATTHFDEVLASRLPPEAREGVVCCSSYFMSIDSEVNRWLLAQIAACGDVDGLWPEGNGLLSVFGEGAYACVLGFAGALEQAGTTASAALLQALRGQQVDAPQGMLRMDPATQHASVNMQLARCTANDGFRLIQRFGAIAPEIPARYRSATCPFPALARDDGREADAPIGTTHAARILSLAETAIIACDARGQITEANHGAAGLFGYAAAEMRGMLLEELLPPHLRGRHAAHLQAFVASSDSLRGMASRSEVVGYRRDGSFFPLEVAIAKFRDSDGWTLVATLRDISERKRAEEQLLWRATHDTLTGLPNRALFRERMLAALQRSQHNHRSLAVLFIDIDGFKLVNDSHGYETGDALLCAVAARLLEQIGGGDSCGRIAGDEFVILCEQLDHEDAVAAMARRVLAALHAGFLIDGAWLYVTASIGIARGHGSSQSADDLLRAAETAMHEVKGRQQDGWQFFNAALYDKARQRIAITEGLRRAIERDEFSLRLQPIVEIGNGRIVAAELLLRWNPPQGEVSPALFIPVAEMTSAILPIGEWAFRAACEVQVAWRSRWGERAPGYLAVNVSARQLLKSDLDEDFRAILQQTGADASRLLLEITETALMADVEINLRVMRRLSAMGLRVAVDDFGTGYSSLSQLTRLPVSVLKVDRVFVDGIETQAESRTIVRTIIGLGQALGLTLVAEGVETEAQRAEVAAQGCQLAQGYLFHRPLDPATFGEVVDRQLAEAARSVAAADAGAMAQKRSSGSCR